MGVPIPNPEAMNLPNQFTGKVDGDYRNLPENSYPHRDESVDPPAAPCFGEEDAAEPPAKVARRC
jgi:hypothetical protein